MDLDLSENTLLEVLHCDYNKLPMLDISGNTALKLLHADANELTSLELKTTALESLDCDFNKLAKLDVSANPSLVTLNCASNALSDLDLSKNPALENLNCSGNLLESLDVSKNLSLSILDCSGNKLSSLELLSNTALKELFCRDNLLTELDLSSNPDITKLYVVNNQLESLNTTHNDTLIELECGNNKLISLELSDNPTLRLLSCRNNPLSSLDISNQEHLFLLDGTCGCGGYLDISEMPNLSEVCVWTMPFPDPDSALWVVFSSGSPNIFYKECVAPELMVSEPGYQGSTVDVQSSEDGKIYLVPENTVGDMSSILADSLASIQAMADMTMEISVEGLENGVYWLYACDLNENISNPGAFSILGVGLDPLISEGAGIFPNPTHGLLHLDFSEMKNPAIEISSPDGHLLYQTKTFGQASSIDLSFLQGGMYFIRITDGDFHFSQKIIKL